MSDDVLSPIYIDRRVGSNELYVPLMQRQIPIELTTLPFGDVAFLGHGPEGIIPIGVERKRVNDLLQSMTSGRLSGYQLPGLCELYPYRWLLVEGSYREGDDGRVQIPINRRGERGWESLRLPYAAVENFLTTLTLRGGLHVKHTYSIGESVAWLVALWKWWTSKEWSEHRSHLQLHQTQDYAIFTPPTVRQRMAAQLPGIDETAIAVARHFPTAVEMVNAEEHQWREIPGIGKIKAANIYKALRSRE